MGEEREKLKVWRPGWKLQKDGQDTLEWRILHTHTQLVSHHTGGRAKVWPGSLSCWEGDGLPGHEGHSNGLLNGSRTNTTAGGAAWGKGAEGKEHRGAVPKSSATAPAYSSGCNCRLG